MNVFKYFLLTFFKKLIWVHYVAISSVFLIKNELRTICLVILVLNILIQQIKVLNSFKDLIKMCKLYGVSLYILVLYNFFVGFILLTPFLSIISFYIIFSVLLTGVIVNTIKIFYHESY